MVTLVRNDEVELVAPALKAPRDRGDHRKLNRVIGLGVSRGDDAKRDASEIERGLALVQDLLSVRQDQDALAARRGTGKDVGEHERLSGPGRGDEQHARRAAKKAAPDVRNSATLIVPEGYRLRADCVLTKRVIERPASLLNLEKVASRTCGRGPRRIVKWHRSGSQITN